ncbi:hypothetical protein [Bradyrhizobium sp. RDT46]|uniref:DUF6894 family protein n=1 Tax=Bradyrhizobium sp. RDT46 TaxID=3341829 RepID=UPI0035C6BE1E
MRFYFTEPGDLPDEEGVEFADADSALQEAAKTALLLAGDQKDVTEELTLMVSSDEGLIGSVTVSVSIRLTTQVAY